jgi:orotate phosphoribosyltransferase
VVIALDRQERGQAGDEIKRQSAIQEVESRYGMPVISIVTLDMVLAYLEQRTARNCKGMPAAIRDYRARYGVAAE